MKALLLLMFTLFVGCAHFPRKTHSMEEVQLKGIDVPQSIQVAEKTLSKDRLGQGLGFWALRDQKITLEDANEISNSYFKHIESISHAFDIWHFTWSISNFYRSASPEVQANLQLAYEDATKRGFALNKPYVTKHLTDSLIYRGWYHGGGWLAARKHLVVPGDDRFLQRASDFKERKIIKGDRWISLYYSISDSLLI